MILEAVVTILLGVVSTLVDVLPVGGASGFGDASGWLYGAGSLNGTLPITEALADVAFLLTVMGATFLFRTIVTLWGMIPGKAT